MSMPRPESKRAPEWDGRSKTLLRFLEKFEACANIAGLDDEECAKYVVRYIDEEEEREIWKAMRGYKRATRSYQRLKIDLLKTYPRAMNPDGHSMHNLKGLTRKTSKTRRMTPKKFDNYCDAFLDIADWLRDMDIISAQEYYDAFFEGLPEIFTTQVLPFCNYPSGVRTDLVVFLVSAVQDAAHEFFSLEHEKQRQEMIQEQLQVAQAKWREREEATMREAAAQHDKAMRQEQAERRADAARREDAARQQEAAQRKHAACQQEAARRKEAARLEEVVRRQEEAAGHQAEAARREEAQIKAGRSAETHEEAMRAQAKARDLQAQQVNERRREEETHRELEAYRAAVWREYAVRSAAWRAEEKAAKEECQRRESELRQEDAKAAHDAEVLREEEGRKKAAMEAQWQSRKDAAARFHAEKDARYDAQCAQVARLARLSMNREWGEANKRGNTMRSERADKEHQEIHTDTKSTKSENTESEYTESKNSIENTKSENINNENISDNTESANKSENTESENTERETKSENTESANTKSENTESANTESANTKSENTESDGTRSDTTERERNTELKNSEKIKYAITTLTDDTNASAMTPKPDEAMAENFKIKTKAKTSMMEHVERFERQRRVTSSNNRRRRRGYPRAGVNLQGALLKTMRERGREGCG